MDFNQGLWEKALTTVEKNLNCSDCKSEHVKLIRQTKINSRAIELKFLNILESGPTTNRLLEYTTPDSIKKVESFMQEHRENLCVSYSETKVDPAVVTALLYMETLFGSEDIPWFKAMDSIVSLAALEDPVFAFHVIETLKPSMQKYKKYRDDPKKWDAYDWNKRAKWIAEDWQMHLRAFFRIAKMQKWKSDKVKSMKSSWAGALGYSQFMPNTALPYFKEDKELDFWVWKDSFRLTSMYLRDEGFAKDTQKALEAYNSPKWYRDTIIHLSHIMRHKHPDFCDKPLT
ncbi:MAG: lytic murein transglycosylase [Bdellovibrionota bacterium]